MNRLFIASVVLLAGSLVSCTSVSRGLGSVTANKFASARDGSVWVVPVPELEPRVAQDKTVFIDFRNQSDADDFDLRDILKDAARAEGWTVVDAPDKANIRLRARTRFFGEVVPESGGKNQAMVMGWIAGAAVGGATYYGVEAATDSWVAGAAAGAGGGGLAGLGIANASTPREWALITDFLVEEYHAEGVEFTLQSEAGSQGGTGAGVEGPRSVDTGGSSRSNVKRTEVRQKSNYFPHGARLSAWANQMNMSEEEAKPLVLERTKKVVKQLLP
jgi:hypothetical protein